MINSAGKLLMESIIETKASTILQFIAGLRGDLRVILEEGTWAAWLCDLLKPNRSCAFEWLERGFEERDDLMTDLTVEPVFDGLRSDPRFQDLIRRVGIPQ